MLTYGISYSPNNNTEQNNSVIWSLEKNNGVLTNNNDGTFTINSNGSETIVVTYNNKKTIYKKIDVTIINYGDVPVTGIDIVGSQNLKLEDKTANYTLKLTPQNNLDNVTVTWRLSDDDVASVDQNGKLTMKNVGYTTISAEVFAENGSEKKRFIKYLKLTIDSNTAKASSVTQKGDLNKDGVVDDKDSSLAMQLYNTGNVTSEQLAIGDMNGDRVIDAADSSLILKKYMLQGNTNDITLNGILTSYGSSSDVATLKLLDDDGNVYLKKSVVGTGDQSFSMENIEAGKYTLEISKPKHTTKTYSINTKKISGTQKYELQLKFLKGDVNGDGTVSNGDARLIILHVRGIKALTEDELTRADINGDGVISNGDARLIIQHVRGIKLLN